MAAVVETHVQSSDAELQSDEEFEESDGGGDSGSDEGDSGSEGEDAEGEDDEDGAAGGEDGAAGGEDGAAGGEDGAAGDEEANANAGWAEAMAKVLSKATAEKQSTILQKSKDLQKVKEKEREEQLERRKKLDKKRSWETMSRVKPDVVRDKEPEKALQRVATRGVVQLFNAVKKHQKSIDEKVKEVGGSERKKAKILSSVSKKDFIDVLRGTDDGPGRSVKKERAASASVKQEDEEAPAWSVLKEDFMMGASMKDWDKESDGEGQGGGAGGEEHSESD